MLWLNYTPFFWNLILFSYDDNIGAVNIINNIGSVSRDFVYHGNIVFLGSLLPVIQCVFVLTLGFAVP